MSEDTTTTDAGAPADTTTDTSALAGDAVTWENSPIAKVYNPDGTPRPDAAQTMAGLGYEDISGHALRNDQDIFTALKTGKDAAAFASQKQEGVTIPTAESSDDDWKAFNKSLGVAETADDFKVGLYPEDLPEGFQKDDALVDMLASHAMKNPVLNAESSKELVSKFIEHQQTSVAKYQEEQQAEDQKKADETKASLTVEMGGTMQYTDFSNDVRDLAVKDLADLGFEFQLGEDGKQLLTDNPLHAAMLADAPTLRLLKSVIDRNKSTGIPGDGTRGASASDNTEKARALYAKYNGNWPNTETMKEYQNLRGIKVS